MKVLGELFFAFFKTCLVTFGGGYAMLPILKDELVVKKNWINEEELFDYLSDVNYINVDATEEISKILNCGGSIDHIVSVSDDNFNNVVSAFNTLCDSQEINHTNLYKHKDVISTGVPHICLEIRPDYGAFDKYYVAMIFPKVILLFLIHKNEPKFLFALNNNALQIRAYTKEKTVPVVIYEKTKNDLSYYEKYNPYSDSKIIRSYWKRTNLDGSRSFAGGLKPENNPINFVLEYGIIELKLCETTLETAFSCSTDALGFCKCAQAFLENYQCSDVTDLSITSEIKEKARSIVARSIVEKSGKKIKLGIWALLILLGIPLTVFLLVFLFDIIGFLIIYFWFY